MSLKAFHVFFIIVSILLALGFGAWEIHTFSQEGKGADLVLGVLSLLAVVGLAVYLRSVLRKLRNVDYL